MADALGNSVNHANVGRFIGRQLILGLVTSYPSNGHVRSLPGIFGNNGQGVRGDLHAVVRAALLDAEAHGDTPRHRCAWPVRVSRCCVLPASCARSAPPAPTATPTSATTRSAGARCWRRRVTSALLVLAISPDFAIQK